MQQIDTLDKFRNMILMFSGAPLPLPPFTSFLLDDYLWRYNILQRFIRVDTKINKSTTQYIVKMSSWSNLLIDHTHIYICMYSHYDMHHYRQSSLKLCSIRAALNDQIMSINSTFCLTLISQFPICYMIIEYSLIMNSQ